MPHRHHEREPENRPCVGELTFAGRQQHTRDDDSTAGGEELRHDAHGKSLESFFCDAAHRAVVASIGMTDSITVLRSAPPTTLRTNPATRLCRPSPRVR